MSLNDPRQIQESIQRSRNEDFKRRTDSERSQWQLGNATGDKILVPITERDGNKMYYVRREKEDGYEVTTAANSGRVLLPTYNDTTAIGTAVICGKPPGSNIFSILEYSTGLGQSYTGFTAQQIELARARQIATSDFAFFRLEKAGNNRYKVRGFTYEDETGVQIVSQYTSASVADLYPGSNSVYVTVWYDPDSNTYIEESGTSAATLTYPDDANLARPTDYPNARATGVLELTSGATDITTAYNFFPVFDTRSDTATASGTSATIDLLAAPVRLSISETDPYGQGTTSTNLYLHELGGQKIALQTFDGWAMYNMPTGLAARIDISALTVDRVYDVVLYRLNNTTVLGAGSTLWTGITRSSDLVLWGTTADGDVLGASITDAVNGGSTTGRYIGSFYLDSSGDVHDTVAQRHVYNYYNQRPRKIFKATNGSTSSWTYNSTTWRAINNDTANAVSILIGHDDTLIDVTYQTVAADNSGTPGYQVGITEDASSISQNASIYRAKLAAETIATVSARYTESKSDQLLTLTAIERVIGAGTATVYGQDALGTGNRAGLIGTVLL